METAASNVLRGSPRLFAAVTQLMLVLLLGFSAVSTELHGWLHELGTSKAAVGEHSSCPHHSHHDDAVPGDETGCVVDLFAHGKVLLASDPFAVCGPVLRSCRVLPAIDSLRVFRTDLLPPACGPPLPVV